jgi:hypothetical protein
VPGKQNDQNHLRMTKELPAGSHSDGCIDVQSTWSNLLTHLEASWVLADPAWPGSAD